MLAKLERCRVPCRPDEFANPLVFAERYHVSQGFHHFVHVISKEIRKADELGHFLLSRGLRKVKDLLNPRLKKMLQFIGLVNYFDTPMPMLPSQSRLNILIKTHPFTCTSYNPFKSLHIDHIGPLPVDDKGNSPISVMIDAFSRWVELFPNKYIVER